METLRIFGRGEAEIESIRSASEDFRQRTMEVLRLAFLSSGILEFLPRCQLLWWRSTLVFPISASWIWSLRYWRDVGCGFSGPDPAPEFFQPLRDPVRFIMLKPVLLVQLTV